MANHLNLRQTLLEFDVHGNLTIFNNGCSVALQARDVLLFLVWLSDTHSQAQYIAGYHFKKHRGLVRIDSLMMIPAEEVPQISSWLQKWKHNHLI